MSDRVTERRAEEHTSLQNIFISNSIGFKLVDFMLH